MPRCILPYVKLQISEDNAKKNQKFLLLSSESNLSKGNENREQNKINLNLFFMPRCIFPYIFPYISLYIHFSERHLFRVPLQLYHHRVFRS